MTKQQQQHQVAYAIVVSIKNSDISVEEFRHHIENILPGNVIKAYGLAKGKGKEQQRRVSGKVFFQSSITDPNQVKKFALQLRNSKLKNQPIAAQVDSGSLVPIQRQLKQSKKDAGSTSRVTNNNDDDDEEDNGSSKWKNAKLVGSKFFEWLHQGKYPGVKNSTSIDLTSVDRDTVHQLFESFTKQTPNLAAATTTTTSSQQRRFEALVLAALKRQKLYKHKRYSDGIVVCSFARMDKTFATLIERKTARDILRQQREVLVSDKGGIHVEINPTTDPTNIPALPINHVVTVTFPIIDTNTMMMIGGRRSSSSPIQLTKISLGGSHSKDFHVTTRLPCTIPGTLELSFKARATGVYRATIFFVFTNIKTGEQFDILRYIWFRAGDADLHDILQPTSPYVKKIRKFDKPVKDVLYPPPMPKGSGGESSSGLGRSLKPFKVPVDIREMVENREIEGSLIRPDDDDTMTTTTIMNDTEWGQMYSTFWQNLLWLSELQAYEDIKLFDMEDATLQRSGRFFKLYVSGLAEGRPSVLRGDLVICNWKGKQYRGRVCAIELLDVLMEFHPSFHKNFTVTMDRVELVRFTFSRTAYRTCHAGCLVAPKTMGRRMLMPTSHHVNELVKKQHPTMKRLVPNRYNWASKTLNEEQQTAVQKITQGTLRPMPYVIFGPPGTGKTTTITEAVFQLARLHTYNSKQPKLKILLVAPSNDATDILVEKLCPYFPPSEMMRVLAYTRSMNQCPPLVQPYVRENLEAEQLVSEIMSVQIVVSTVSLAARFWCTGEGLKKGWFDVVCVDEAGHATEPEVIGATASIMDFSGKNAGQLVLAGDPNQLGPIITSELCKKFGMGMSYMERLVNTSPAYKMDDNDTYPPDLVTFLVRNYRSHPAILKLPNELFYRSKLVPCGDRLTTHSMTKWEHLPNSKAGFPIIFHAVDGENQREGTSPSWFNPQEAITVVETVSLLVKHSRPAIRQDEIGIITPYARQVQKIRLLLKAKDMGDIKVGSVETFQGQERRCIIISTVRSENNLLEHDRKYNLGFVANEKRFNVAVTRAKALLVVIGNPRVLQTDTKNWLPLLRYCRDNESWQGQEWDENATATEDVDDLIQMLKEGKIDNGNAVNEQQEIEDDDGWAIVTDQEARGYINREE